MKKAIKKYCSIFLPLIIMVLSFMGLYVNDLNTSTVLKAYALTEYEEGGYLYTLDYNDNATIKAVNQYKEGNITVPTELGGHKVVAIGEAAFIECKYIESIVIPNSISYIGSNAFSRCTRLKNVTLPTSLKKIEYETFNYCSSLENIVIPYGVCGIGARSFFECSNLKSITFSETVKYIDTAAFYGCKSLDDIIIPNGVTYIGLSAFSRCSSLTNISIPNTVTEIEESAFSSCESLEILVIPDSVTSIEKEICSSCFNLKKVIVGDAVTSIPTKAFDWCINLSDITIGKSVKSIGEYAFYNCNNLKEIVLSDSVERIDYDIFSGCESLEIVHIPAATTSIGEWLLYGQPKAHVCSETDDCFAKEYCKENGYRFTQCTGHHVHHFSSEITVKPSCTEFGSETCTCVCGDSYTRTLPFSHSPSNWEIVLKPTLFSEGKKELKCLTCGKILADEIIPRITDNSNNTENKNGLIAEPSVKSISYGDSIVIRIDESWFIPDDCHIDWSVSNDNFKIVSVTSDGRYCKITPKSSGYSNIYVAVYDEEYNLITSDAIEMKSNAGFFDKIIALFKKIFGLTKTINQ